jgi:hypothetical protein
VLTDEYLLEDVAVRTVSSQLNAGWQSRYANLKEGVGPPPVEQAVQGAHEPQAMPYAEPSAVEQRFADAVQNRH